MTTKITTPGGGSAPVTAGKPLPRLRSANLTPDQRMERLAQTCTDQAVATLATLMTGGQTQDVRNRARAALQCRMIDVAFLELAREGFSDDA